ncbi:MAG: 2-hydroxyacid dehydrogenase [Phycisphaerales bacterium]
MRTVVYSAKRFERPFFDAANAGRHEILFLEESLTARTATLAQGHTGVCLFVNDVGSGEVLRALAQGGARLIVLRSAGFNHVDVHAAEELGLTVARVPAYSPHAVAEHSVGLMLTLNRKFHRAYARVREQNFALDGLMGFDMQGKVVGVVGTGNIGEVVCRILLGFGCEVLACDPKERDEVRAMGVRYVALNELLGRADIVTLHCPLTPGTKHLIDDAALARMKPGAMLINTSRGAVVDSRAVIGALKQGRLGALGLDVYEEEGDLFFRDLSERVIDDDVFVRLMTFPNVLITAHQAFFTREAMTQIARTTIDNMTGFEGAGVAPENLVTRALVANGGKR